MAFHRTIFNTNGLLSTYIHSAEMESHSTYSLNNKYTKPSIKNVKFSHNLPTTSQQSHAPPHRSPQDKSLSSPTEHDRATF